MFVVSAVIGLTMSISQVLSLEMAQFERAIATMRFYDEAGVRSNRVLVR